MGGKPHILVAIVIYTVSVANSFLSVLCSCIAVFLQLFGLRTSHSLTDYGKTSKRFVYVGCESESRSVVSDSLQPHGL